MCNAPGSTRTFSTLGLTLTEQLDVNIGSYSDPLPDEPLFAQIFGIVGDAALDEAFVSNVTDLLQVTANGSGAEISWHVQGNSFESEACRY